MWENVWNAVDLLILLSQCIDIKESDKGYPYAFIRYYSLKAACAAKKFLNEELLHDRSMKVEIFENISIFSKQNIAILTPLFD